MVDDDPSTLRLLEVVLRERGLQPTLAQGSIAAKSMLEQKSASDFDCALVDYRMPGMNGLEFVAWLLSVEPEISTVLMTAEGDMDLVTGALRQGVVDYVEKPFRRPDLYEALFKAAELTSERRYRASAAEGVREITLINDRLVPQADALPTTFAPGYKKTLERTFRPFGAYVPANVDNNMVAGLSGLFVAVAVPCVMSWALFGTELRRWLKQPRHARAFNITMAIVLIASLIPILRAY